MVNYREVIQNIEVAKSFNVKDELQHLPVEQIRKYQPKNNFAIACMNITGSLNIGNITRSAVLFGAQKMFIFGRTKYDKRSTVGAENYIDIETHSCMIDPLTIDYDHAINYIDTTHLPVFVEYTNTAIDINEYRFSEMCTPCFIFGNEGFGIPDEILSKYSNFDVVKINQYGVMRSLNVATTAGIVMHTYVSNHVKK